MNLKGKTAIVTGASSGLGAMISKHLVEQGAIVYGLARRMDRLEKLRKTLNESSQFIPVQLDITNTKALAEWVSTSFTTSAKRPNSENTSNSESSAASQGPTRDHHSTHRFPDILINNAGFGFFGRVEETPLDTWRTLMDVNLNGVFYMTRLILPLMKKNPSVCHIINISSVAGLMGNEQLSAYNASKFGLRGFTEALFKEVRKDGIKVTCLFPGSISTEFFDNTPMQVHSNMMKAEDVSHSILHVLQTPDNVLISELTMRPLDPSAPTGR